MTEAIQTPAAPVRKPFGKTSNPTELVFPTDPAGNVSLLKKEALICVNNLSGSDEKFRVFKETLQVLMQHATEKLRAQKAARVVKIADAAAASERERARYVAEQTAAVDALRRNVVAAEARLRAAVGE